MTRKFAVEYVYLESKYGPRFIPEVKTDKFGEIYLEDCKDIKSPLMAELKKMLLNRDVIDSLLFDWCFNTADDMLNTLSEFDPSGHPIYSEILNFVKTENARVFIQYLYLNDEKVQKCYPDESLVHGFVRETECALIVLREIEPSSEEVFKEKLKNLEDRITQLEKKVKEQDKIIKELQKP